MSKHSFTHQTLECIDLLVQYGYDFEVALKADVQLRHYLNNALGNIIVKQSNYKILSHLIELGADPTSGDSGIPHLVEALDRHDCKNRRSNFYGRRGRGRGRINCTVNKHYNPHDYTCKVAEVARILIAANCGGINVPDGCRRPSALRLAIAKFHSLVVVLLKAGATVNESIEQIQPTRYCYLNYDDDTKNNVQLAEEYLKRKLLEQFLTFKNGIKMSLKFQCRLYIRNLIGICSYRKLKK